MLLLEELLTPLAALLHLPVGVAMFVALMLSGVVGHYAIYRVVRRLTTAADRTDTRWDDVVLYAIFPPTQWVMWVVLGLWDDEFHLRSHQNRAESREPGRPVVAASGPQQRRRGKL